MEYLDFELPIKEINDQLDKCKLIGDESDIDISDTYKKLEIKLVETKKKVYSNLTSWQRVQLSRHPSRPYTLDYIKGICGNSFLELHGDRNFKDDKAMILLYYRYNRHAGYRARLGGVFENTSQSSFGSRLAWPKGAWEWFADLSVVKDREARLAYDAGVQYTSCCWRLHVHVNGLGRNHASQVVKPRVLLSLSLVGMGG